MKQLLIKQLLIKQVLFLHLKLYKVSQIITEQKEEKKR